MGHNVSPQRTRARVMASRLAQWRGSWLCLGCDRPGHPSRRMQIPVEEAEAREPGLIVEDWCRRLRCAAPGCGKPPEVVALRIPAMLRQRGREDSWIGLVGLGAASDGGRADQSAAPDRVEWWRDIDWGIGVP